MSRTRAAAVARSADAGGGVGQRNVLLVFAGLIVAMLLSSLDQTIFSTALPTIVGDLHGVRYMLWVTTAYLLASTITLPIYGKLGDLVGRKGLFIVAIAVFIAGSTIGGLSRSMTALIVGRAIQGLGGGGLMLLSQAIIADVVPARQRGRYTGVIGAVFAVSSVAGPLLGGYFTEGPGWRWAFWMNVPLGLLSIVLAARFLRLPGHPRERPSLDVAGMGLIALASTTLVLTSTWAGTTYAWSSPVVIALVTTTVVAAVLFVLVERSAKEPIMPLHLFADRTFDLATAAGLATGVAMFGTIAYIPTYLQMVTGAGATRAGLLTIPLLAGLLVSSVVSGQVVSATGRYKYLPVAGSVVVAGALALLSTITVGTSLVVLCTYLAVMGLGLGTGMQILVLVVQNSFPAREVGTATAANTYFRQIGASLGAAVVGTVFSSRLASRLAGTSTSDTSPSLNSLTPDSVRALPGAAREVVVRAYNDALAPIFLYLVPLVVVAAVLLLFIDEKPLATSNDDEAPGEPADVDGTSRALDRAHVGV